MTEEKRFSREKIITKIRSLQAVANHEATGDGERMAAIASIKRLSDQYSISLDEVEKADAHRVIEDFVMFRTPMSKDREWTLLALSSIGKFLNTQILTASSRSEEIRGIFIIGTQLDVETMKSIVPSMMQQFREAVQKFYIDSRAKFNEYVAAYNTMFSKENSAKSDIEEIARRKFAIDRANRNKMAAAPVSFRMVTVGGSNSSSNDAAYIMFSFAESFSYDDVLEHVAKKLFAQTLEMPSINSEQWLEIESDWGKGCVVRLSQRLMEEEKQSEPMVVGSRYQHDGANALVTMADQVRFEKMSNISTYLASQDIKYEDRGKVKDRTLYEAGQRKGDEIDLSAVKS